MPRRIDWLPAEEFWFTSSRGKRIHNLLVKPPGFDPQKKYPLFVVIHGGPHSMWKDDFVVRWNYHLLAQPGYVVLLTNYSGSTGFGEAFARSIQGDPLEGPANEVNEAADEAIKRYAFIDGSRQAAGGASYGGHLANWLAVEHRSLPRAGEPRGPLRPAQPVDHQRRRVQPRAQHRRPGVGRPSRCGASRARSTARRSSRRRSCSPTARRTSACRSTTALEFWTVLQRQDVPSRLVVFPDENHWVLKGENSRYFYEEVHGWLAKYL